MANYYSSTIQKGSTGDDALEWQKFLKSKGYYNGALDGDFGDVTDQATRAYQTDMGLTVDGIVGEKTWGSAGYTYLSPTAPTRPSFDTTATATPNVGKAPTGPAFDTNATDLPVTDTTSWDETEKGQAALGAYNTAKDNVNNYETPTYDDYVMGEDAQAAKDALDAHNANKPGAYQSQWQGQLDSLMNSIMNRDKFSYNFNEDALYQQYKDKYIQQGKMAMADTMGQAAAMTGGYGNSYAASVGNQAYQAQLQNLNDIVPELYQMAREQYIQEGQDLYNQYGLVMDRENTDYGRYRDTVSDWLTDRGYLTDRYNTESDRDYSRYIDNRDFKHTLDQEEYQRLLDSLGIASDDYYSGGDVYRTEQGIKNDDAWKNYQASEEARQYANSLLQQGYQNEFGAWEADSNNAWKEYQAKEDARQYENSLIQQGYQNEFNEWDANTANYWRDKEFDAQYGSSGNGSGNGNKGTTPSGVDYDNGSVSTEDIIAMQEALGVGADGYWGPKSTEAAGGLTADEAYEAWINGELGATKPPKNNWTTNDQSKVEENQKEYGGSYYTTAHNDLKTLKSNGMSYSEAVAYIKEMLDSSLITQSEYMTLVQKARNIWE